MPEELTGAQRAELRDLLETARREIEAQLDASREDARPVDLDEPIGRLTRMDAMQQQAMAQESGRRRQLELKRIASALKRLDDEEYGYCLTCGEAIPVARLGVDPATTLCVPCASRAEG